MGLDSTVKTHLRGIAKSVFAYSSTLKNVWEKHKFGALVIDMNVELFRKPHTCATGRQWAEYIYRARIKGAQSAKVVVLLFDSASRVPEVKDLCHLDRNTKKRKRGGFVPLPKSTVINDGKLPDWGRVTGSKHILPAVWNYLIRSLKSMLSEDVQNTKTVYFDTPFSPMLAVKWPNLDGKVHLGWKGDIDKDERPCHMYGEGDLKTLSWCKCLLEKWGISKILVMSTDLDNIGIFCRPQYKGVYMMGNTVYIDKTNTVVPRSTKPKKAPEAKSAYEVIHLGGLPEALGPTWDAFVNVLTLSKVCLFVFLAGWGRSNLQTDENLHKERLPGLGPQPYHRPHDQGLPVPQKDEHVRRRRPSHFGPRVLHALSQLLLWQKGQQACLHAPGGGKVPG